MKRIIVLEPVVANKIAAGEVVERPASIVKELVENSLDAGSTAITIEMRGGGLDYLRVTDNGSGIDNNDVPTAFLRHATSKLVTVEDLDNIESFGFRGEALASIAAVSKLSMRTRTEDAEHGTHIVVEGGIQSILEPCACPVGTTIEVNELFYNVPARLKFIKNQRTETALITDYVSRLMLANPAVAIKLINNGRPVLTGLGSGELLNTVFSVYGSSVFASLYEVKYDDGYIRITGYVGGENISRSNRIQQSLFVNRRYVKSPLVSNAVQRAYLTRLMNHRFPFFVLNILIASQEVDVNVHPNKLTVRFRDEERIASSITKAVTEALKGSCITAALLTEEKQDAPPQTAFINSKSDDAAEDVIRGFVKRDIDPFFGKASDHTNKYSDGIESEVRALFKNGGGVFEKSDTSEKDEPDESLATFGNWFKPKSHEASLRDSGVGPMPDFLPTRPQDAAPFKSAHKTDIKWQPESDSGSVDTADLPDIPTYAVVGPSALTLESKTRAEQLSLNASSCRIIGAAFDTYIIVQQDDALYYIDQHAAHERMLYEKLINGKLKFDSQLLAVPLMLSLDPISLNCLEQNLERFEEFGYSVEISPTGVVSVSAVPNLVGAGGEKFFRDAIDCLIEKHDAGEIDLLRAELIQMSCKRAVKAGDMLDIRQLQAIVDEYSGDSVPLTCPHGRPVIIKITKNELQKLFKRII